METILLIAVVGTLNIACFFVGAKVGQAVAAGKEIEAPVVKSPLTAYKEYQERREAEKEQDRIAVIMRNVEQYDGTGAHQEDVPRG
ncbi:MAG: hypothetical protein E7288_10540 [Lachnospiraceae bacterium]|nr:hypothetical protein [Lachnospiraceae bacterium]